MREQGFVVPRMKQLARLLRAAQLHAHAAHNLTRGETFFSDHEFLGTLYRTYETAYDGVIERMLGLGDKVQPDVITADAADDVIEYDYDTAQEIFTRVLRFEEQIVDEISTTLNAKLSVGTENFLQDLADKSEARQYLIKRRLL